MLETDSESLICIDLNDDWCVKIVDRYNNFDYLIIKDNIDIDISEIESISDIFNHIILPKTKDPYGIDNEWVIYDMDNLYTINELKQSDWKSSNNPICFESESEYYSQEQYYQEKSSFDRITENF